MPYHVEKSSTCPASKPYAVIKDADGEVMGCHASEDDAHKQIAAIHANEGAAVTDTLEDFHGNHNQKDHGRSAGPKIDRSMPKGTTPKGHTPKIGKTIGETVTLTAELPMAITGGGGDGYDLDFQSSGTPWEGILAVEGVETGDGRMFAEGAITWMELPIPLRRNIEDSHGGTPSTKTVLVGRIDNIWRDPEQPTIIRGAGVFDDDGEHGAEALRLVKSKFLKGVSVDPDDIKDTDVEAVYPELPDGEDDEDELMSMFFAQPELTIFHAGRLRAATLVDIPAFIEAKVWLVDPSTVPAAMTAAAHFHSLVDSSWNASAVESRLPARMSLAVARSAYAHCGTTDDGDTLKVSARFLHHEVSDGGDIGAANLTACSVGIRAITSGRADSLTPAERRSAYLHLAQHLKQAGIEPQPYEVDDGLIAALDLLEGPPAEWFTTEEPDGFMPPTVMDDVTAAGWRRFAGHGAIWGTCHMGFGGACVEPPKEPNGDHAYYRLGEVVCADGSRIAVGNITLGTGHAPTRGISASQAAEHYDNTGTVVALVASSEGKHGIWLAGAVPPWVDATRVAQLQASGEVSGDWRRIGGSMRLVAFLAVNTPGFPVPRLKTAIVRGKQLALVAAGTPRDTTPRVRVRDDVTRLAVDRIAKGIGLDARSRLAALRERVGS